ncbi:3' terminal RNA ribose 2'-O-methyltransferase Hen1 [Kibdelosporangium philippinense]|uniref:Small RNA 2'-O-methyltransferase n=1 Tax=Kibdelosporangium philippinense TaxID=211113 RepID=A0ABS8ZS12_9PSEU|nr:3' terminal RNA ribose 2'-O-methyltransferase Hen1 [Kibdelosporangium philippinense]MCE7008607.1 3' terminal RNA ribose 2'-O-methyltransferase Hen1 [Kibdelosporangium philippinense]
MLLTLTTTHRPATDLGFLLHKHPEKAQSFPIAAGMAHVFYPTATEDECTAALLLDIDPIELVRGRYDRAFTLNQYVNDRPYAAGSMMAVALSAVFKTAMNGVLKSRQELADTAIPLSIHIPAVPSRGGPELVVKLFEPLGWQVEAKTTPLDPQFPEWGDSPYIDLRLTGTHRLSEALRHLYVLLPVLDNAKHYWVTEEEVTKLLRAGEGWLAEHPSRELISQRYLKHRKAYVRFALSRLAEADESDEEELDNALEAPIVEEEPDRPVPLALQRRGSVVAALKAAGAQRVLDLGCGGGALLRDLIKEPTFTEIVGVDVSARALEVAARKFERTPERVRSRLTLKQSALTYVDKSLKGFDAAVLMEVIEHLDEPRLPALERSVFGEARPATVVVTTPNVEYNVRFPTLPVGKMRHSDHRFEWTRAQFRAWADSVAERYDYHVRYLPVGQDDPEVGPPTQLAVFEVTR